MNWNSLINRVVKIGVREGLKFLKDSQKSSGQPQDGRSSGGSGSGRPESGRSSSGRSSSGRSGSGQHHGAESGSGRPTPGGSSHSNSRSQASSSGEGAPTADYPGDFHGRVHGEYSPNRDGSADPGEIVWGWIPFEEDHSQGKDRPSLIVGKDGQWALALMLTSKDHIPGGYGEVRSDRNARWMNIGSGDWDAQRRPSEIRLDRVIRLHPDSIRREGAVMPREVFQAIIAEVDAS